MYACAGIAGYVSAAQYKVMGGTNWVRNVLTTACLFCGPLLLVFSFLNTVAIAYGVSACPTRWAGLHLCSVRPCCAS